MRVLLGAFVCEPGAGSEPGNGWTWAVALAEHYDVTVLTDVSSRPAIESAQAQAEVARLQVEYLGTGLKGLQGLTRIRYYHRWQHLAAERGRALHDEAPFDVVHHVTYGAHRIPSQLWRVPAPFLWGPVGGGEGVPVRFYTPRWVGAREAIMEWVRAASNAFVKVDPRMRRVAREATAYAVTTRQTLEAFPRDTHARALILPSSIMDRTELQAIAQRQATPGPATGLRLLYVGRLVGWKGLGLALRAFAAYAEDRPTATFEIYGRGRAEAWVRGLIDRLGIGDRVRVHGFVPRDDLLQLYADHHVLLFPSLHDSSGYTTIEAQAAGLPIVCLDTGGPGAQVPAAAGVKVPAHSPRQAVAGLARGLVHLTDDQAAWQSASDAARAHALDPAVTPTIDDVVAQLYGAAGLPDEGAR